MLRRVDVEGVAMDFVVLLIVDGQHAPDVLEVLWEVDKPQHCLRHSSCPWPNAEASEVAGLDKETIVNEGEERISIDPESNQVFEPRHLINRVTPTHAHGLQNHIAPDFLSVRERYTLVSKSLHMSNLYVHEPIVAGHEVNICDAKHRPLVYAATGTLLICCHRICCPRIPIYQLVSLQEGIHHDRAWHRIRHRVHQPRHDLRCSDVTPAAEHGHFRAVEF
mmetsp:Transcript_25902/g.54700  ORF Transcript_25902/g.54700 Transcript_25902/m.54700 type:complete len:221 (-) Transcript_25902:1167-1829(-)